MGGFRIEPSGHLPRRSRKRRGRHAARGQGSLRHGRADDDVRLDRLRRARARADGRGGAPARGRRLRERRQDEPARVRLRDHLGEPPLRDGAEPRVPGRMAGGSSGGSAAALAAGPRRRGARAPTRAARSGSPPRAAGSSASSRATGSSRSRAASRSRRASTTQGRWRERSASARRCWGRSPTGSSRSTLELARGGRGGSRVARRRPILSSTRACARRPRCFPRRRELDFPLPGDISAVFMREVADVHRDLFAEFEDSYGENVAHEDRALPARSPTRSTSAACGARAEYRERAEAALDGVDSPHPDAGVRRAYAPADDLEIRSGTIRLTSRSTRSAGRRSRFRAALPRTGCRPRSRSSARGLRRLVLAVGVLLESASPSIEGRPNESCLPKTLLAHACPTHCCRSSRAARAHRGRPERHGSHAQGAEGPEGLPAARQRAGVALQPQLPAHAGLRLEPRRRREALRVRALDERELRRGRAGLVERRARP